MPISYSGRTYLEGKKIRATDGFRALWEMFRCRVVDTQFTDHSGFYILLSVARATRYNQWILDQVQPFLGQRLFEAGAGIGNLSHMLIHRERLLLVDHELEYVNMIGAKSLEGFFDASHDIVPGVSVKSGGVTSAMSCLSC